MYIVYVSLLIVEGFSFPDCVVRYKIVCSFLCDFDMMDTSKCFIYDLINMILGMVINSYHHNNVDLTLMTLRQC